MTAVERHRLGYDALAIAASVGVAGWLVWSGVLDRLLVYTGTVRYLESFAAGMFFTSAFTTAPAIAVVGEIAQRSSPWSVALWGGLGALSGDLILFRFVKDRVADDLLALLGERGRGRVYRIAERRMFRWFSPLIAALVLASPIPDELGVAFLGFAKTRTPVFVLFSFCANFVGLLAIALIAAAAR